MDAVVARDEENMTAPESQQYAQCFLLFGYSDLNYLQVSQYWKLIWTERKWYILKITPFDW